MTYDPEDHGWIEDDFDDDKAWEAGAPLPRIVVKEPTSAPAGVSPPIPESTSESGPSGGGTAATLHVPLPKPAPWDENESLSYRWNLDEDGEYVRITKALIRMFQDEDITENDFAAFLAISEKAYSTLFCWGWSEDDLAVLAGMSKPQFRTACEHLIKLGYLAIEPWRHTKGHGHDTNTYILYPRCNKYHIGEIIALREHGEPDPTRSRNLGIPSATADKSIQPPMSDCLSR